MKKEVWYHLGNLDWISGVYQ